MRLLLLLLIYVLFSCKQEKHHSIIGTWQKAVSPSLAKLINTNQKDSLEHSAFFYLEYTFKVDSTFSISNSDGIRQHGNYLLSKDSLLTFNYITKEELKSELAVLESKHKDSLKIMSEFGSVTFLSRK